MSLLARAAKRLVDQIDRAHDAYVSQVAAGMDSAVPLVTADPVAPATAEAPTPFDAEPSAVASPNPSPKDL